MKFYACFPLLKLKKQGKQTVLAAPFLQRKVIKYWLMRLKLLSVLIVCALLKVSGSLHAQSISLQLDKVPLEQAFLAIEKQSNHLFWYDKALLKGASRVSLQLKNATLKEALDGCFKGQPLTYELVDQTIVVKGKPEMKRVSTENQLNFLVKGKIVDEQNQPLAGVNVRVNGSNIQTMSDLNGAFSLEVAHGEERLVFSYLGKKNREISAFEANNKTIVLLELREQLEAVSIVNTGYQQLPKERATGSFVQIDQNLLNRRVSTHFLDRLDGITSGLIFNKTLSNSGASPRNEVLGISIRGRSTIDSKVSADPLIVIDDFPFEGDPSQLNPDDIESVTILRDAAAASIWGARSGNGVIVITTKKGKAGEALQIHWNANTTLGERPNLQYSRNYLEAPAYIAIETHLFEKGMYDTNLGNNTTYPLISPVVELLAQRKAGSLSEAQFAAEIDRLSQLDVREDIARYLNRSLINQQYALNFQGGTGKSAYLFSSSFDRQSRENRSDLSRLSFNAHYQFRPLKNLEIQTNLRYSRSEEIRSYGYSPAYPYIQLADAEGNALAVPYGFRKSYLESTLQQGYLDWTLKPLDEAAMMDLKVLTDHLLFKSSVKYRFLSHFDWNVLYQFENQSRNERRHQPLGSYATRDLINRFSQRGATGTFTYPIPLGGIVNSEESQLFSHNFRTQLNYQQQWKGRHQVNALAGAEIRSIEMDGSNYQLYGYDNDLGIGITNLNYATTFPQSPAGLGSRVIPSPSGLFPGQLNRYLSYYVNAAYTYADRYTFSLSGRKDGANIFGVKTNEKITPLWSAGAAWELSREPFYSLEAFPYLKLRATYGFNGNVYNASAYLTASYRNEALNGIPVATVTSPPNPLLRWEKIRNTNLGLDFKTKDHLFSGSIDVYHKLASDLIEDALLPPSSGFKTFKGNAASLQTKGVDFILNSEPVRGKFGWTTQWLLSLQRDKVVHFDTDYSPLALARFDQTSEPAVQGVFPVIGNPLFGVYSYRFAGLDPANGDPVGYLNGEKSKDYTAILNSLSLEDIVFHGSSRPNLFGSWRNTFQYGALSLSFNLVYKFDYYFRKKSIHLNYAQLLNSPHQDYYLRWQQPGDENDTHVPSLVDVTNDNRNTFYRSSDVLVEKADHIRLQDITLSYDFGTKLRQSKWLKGLQFYSYVNNVGILWKANKAGIDPDVNDLGMGYRPLSRTFAFGIRGHF